MYAGQCQILFDLGKESMKEEETIQSQSFLSWFLQRKK